ncbi:MAG: hypothetical protein J6I96_03265 [Oscillospiraceae bacterium]|nr:hypothetical protein [Oscillospiraceae bacterium]
MKKICAVMVLLAAAGLAGCQSRSVAEPETTETTAAETVSETTASAVTAAETADGTETYESAHETSVQADDDGIRVDIVTVNDNFLGDLNAQMDKFNSVDLSGGVDSTAEMSETAAETETSADSNAGDTVRVGKDGYGYVTVPSDWVKAEQDPDIELEYFEYDDPTGKCEIVMTCKQDYYSQLAADDMYDFFEQSDGYTVTDSFKSTVDGYTAYRIDVRKDADRTLIMWILQDDDLLTHFVNIECPAEDTDKMLEIASTYSVTK